MRLALIFLAVLAGLGVLSLSAGAVWLPPRVVWQALTAFDPGNYDHFILTGQRLPRVLMAAHAGAVMAVCGLVLQGLTRNPLAAPGTLGISAGAVLFVVAGAFFLDLGLRAQGVAALAGGAAGFGLSLLVARLAGFGRDMRGLSLILAGVLVSMLAMGVATALLLSDPARRDQFLGWISGNINHVYMERFRDFWWIGVLSLGVLLALARPLTLMTLGADKAASAGVNLRRTEALALAALVAGAASVVAISGPVGFVGLVVPHIVRPLVGAGLSRSIPAAAVLGAAICLLADLLARQALAPVVLHTGVVLDLAGGIVFVLIVRRYYLTPGARRV